MGITSLTMPEAALIALSGLVIVFIILAVLALAVKLISKVIVATDRKAAPVAAAPAPAAAGAPAAAPAVQHYAGEVALIGVDEKTAACIMAIVSDETGIPLSELVFKKIKAL